ncbi:MAG: ribonucleoside-diphosphate reductase subunit alpha [Gemmatimonadota bacterium]|nr:ribonucleoside-diphosphate reductase subunit alpha [Gemmatimonadota bacterium]
MEPPVEAATFREVRKRDGRKAPYSRDRIAHAVEMAFRAEARTPYPDALDHSIHDAVERVADQVEQTLAATLGNDACLEIEVIQDEVEHQLMAGGHFAVARRFIVYREARARGRAERRIRLKEADGRELMLDRAVLRAAIAEAASGLGPAVDVEAVYREMVAGLYDGITREEISKAGVMAARARTEREPEYAWLAARLMLIQLYTEALGTPVSLRDMELRYPGSFEGYLHRGVTAGLLDPALLNFDLPRIAGELRAERDLAFAFLGVQTLYDRYLLHENGVRFELPQWFWMRVAMGLALAEAPEARTERAIEFYGVLSTFTFCSSTPTLFNAGTRHPQLSSCFLTTVPDDLGDIFKAIRDDAMLSKWSGGLGNDWTPVRALGSRIRGTNGVSQGVIPFLKVANDTAVAVNQGGKRQGAICAYLESWHLDLEEFLELRKNTGDDRRRTHDMHTAHWIPDLFMKRVREDGSWTLFSPSDVPDLHDLYGAAFEARYEEYERLVDQGAIPLYRRLRAVDLWRRMLAMLFETGHPWLTWKDPSNIRSPQDHAGVVHNSNLCTEILLNTSPDEVAVCNLGSVNLAAHIDHDGLNVERLARTVRVAVRMLDNVIDINLYPIPEARAANLRHRPVGLGVMGFQDALHRLGLSYASEEAVEFADTSMEVVAWHAILASANLASERGAYPSYPGSKWDRGLFPIDTLDLLEAERGLPLSVERAGQLDWAVVREAVRNHGMRNSNVLAIAPTATIANICDVSQSIEPNYKNLYVKSNLSGDFAVLNRYLVEDLRKIGLWDARMVEDLKYHDGTVSEVDRVPDALKDRYRTAFEIDAEWLIRCAARRQKWIDMGQSLNLYLDRPSGRQLSSMYLFAWESGLKTTYYLRTRGAGGVEASTIDINSRGIQPRWMKSESASSRIRVERSDAAAEQESGLPASSLKACDLDGNCEACQ